MTSTLMPYLSQGLLVAPITSEHGSGLPFATGDVRDDATGLPPRGAPV